MNKVKFDKLILFYFISIFVLLLLAYVPNMITVENPDFDSNVWAKLNCGY